MPTLTHQKSRSYPAFVLEMHYRPRSRLDVALDDVFDPRLVDAFYVVQLA